MHDLATYLGVGGGALGIGIAGTLAVARAWVQGSARRAVAREEGAAAVVPELRALVRELRDERTELRERLDRVADRLQQAEDRAERAEQRADQAVQATEDCETRSAAQADEIEDLRSQSTQRDDVIAELQTMVERLSGVAPSQPAERWRRATPQPTRYVDPEPQRSQPPSLHLSDRKDLEP